MSWGNGIFIVFVVFAVLMGTLVYKCTNQNFELVSKEYYNDELRYQETIDGSRNANALSSVKLSQTSDEITIRLPKELDGLALHGEAWFYCAPRALNDRKIAMHPDKDGMIRISKSRLAKSNYKLKLTWKTGDVPYYNEQNIQVNQ